jgi:hypothetical protein
MKKNIQLLILFFSKNLAINLSNICPKLNNAPLKFSNLLYKKGENL